jgi:DNA end-binding protein Ku
VTGVPAGYRDGEGAPSEETTMPRAIWTGSVNFGLVNVPVGLFSATEDRTVHFNQFQRGTSDRIRYKRVNERTGEEVDYKDIVKGHDVGGGDYVVVEPEELEAIAPGRSRTLDITGFVDLDEVDPIYFQKTYYLAPQGEQYARTYSLLLRALQDTNRAGIATFVMRGKEYLTALRAEKDVLVLETMFFADEVRDTADLQLPSGADFRGKELTMARQLIESMALPWRPEDYADSFREKVEDLIAAKRKGEQVVTEGEPPEPTKVVDLMEALRASVESAKSQRDGSDRSRRGGSAQPGRRAPSSRKQAASATPDLDGLSKAELDTLARDLDVPGRSKMTKEQLASAVAGARAAKPARRKKAS